MNAFKRKDSTVKSKQIQVLTENDQITGGSVSFDIENELKVFSLRLNKVFATEYTDGQGNVKYENIDVEDYPLYFNDDFLSRLRFKLQRRKHGANTWNDYIDLTADQSQTYENIVLDSSGNTAKITSKLSTYGDDRPDRKGQYYYNFHDLPIEDTDGVKFEYRIIELDSSVGDFVKIFYPSGYGTNGIPPCPGQNAQMQDSTEDLNFILQYSDDNGAHYYNYNPTFTATIGSNSYTSSSADYTMTIPKEKRDVSGKYEFDITGLVYAVNRSYRLLTIKGSSDYTEEQTVVNGTPDTISLHVVANGKSKYFLENDPSVVSSNGSSQDAIVRNIFLGKSIILQKLWNDHNNADGLRPEILDVQLTEKVQAISDDITLTKQVRNSDSWKRTVYLPRYFYNGELPKNNVQFTVDETLSTAKLYYDAETSPYLSDVGYTKEEAGYINKQTGNNDETYNPVDFADSNVVLSGTENPEFVGLYVKNKKELVNSKLTFKKEWDDDEQTELRPDAIYIKTLRRKKGSVSPASDGSITLPLDSADTSVVLADNKQPVLIEGLEAHDSTDHPYTYFTEPVLPITVIERGNNLIDLSLDLSGIDTTNTDYSFKLKRRVAEYTNVTYTPSEYVYTVPFTDAINNNYSLKIPGVPVNNNENGAFYTYTLKDAEPGTATITGTLVGSDKKDLVIQATSTTNFTFKVQRSYIEDVTGITAKKTSASSVSYAPVGNQYTIPRTDAVDGVVSVTIDALPDVESGKTYVYSIESSTGENVTFTPNAAENPTSLTITAEVENDDFIFMLKRTVSEFIDTDAIRYYDESSSASLITFSADGDGIYTISSSFKTNGFYAFRITAIDNTKQYRLVDVNSAEIKSTSYFSGNDLIVRVEQDGEELKFKLQSKASTEGARWEDVTSPYPTVTKYYEDIVTKDKNQSDLRVEYYPKNDSTDTVTADNYSNTIGYEDMSKEGNSYKYQMTVTPSGNTATVTVPASYAFDGKISVLVKGVPYTDSTSYTITNADNSGTTTGVGKYLRQTSSTTADILLIKNVGENPTDVTFTITPSTGTLPGSLTVVRFFEGGTNGIVKLPKDVNVSLAENLAYGESENGSESSNGHFEKYYYTVVECDEDGTDAQAALAYSQDAVGTANVPTSQKLTFEMLNSQFPQENSAPRKYVNIKIVNNADISETPIKKDINGDPLKLKLTCYDSSGNIITGDDGKQDINYYYASDQEHNIPVEGVIVIPLPDYCDKIVCEVDGLPYKDASDNVLNYSVKRCKAGGATHDETLPVSGAQTNTGTNLQHENTSFTFTKTWAADSQKYGTKPSTVHFALFRSYEGDNLPETDRFIDSYNITVPTQLNEGETEYKVTRTITTEADDTTLLPAGVWVESDDVKIWKPYTYYIKEFTSAYDNSAPNATPEKSGNSSYQSVHTYDPDKPFEIATTGNGSYTYATLDQGLENSLQLTKHEFIKVWDDNNNASNSRNNYKISLKRKTGKTALEYVDLRHVKINAVSVDKDTKKKTYTKVTVPSSEQPVTSLTVPQQSLYYSFESLPAYDKDGMKYYYYVEETAIGLDGSDDTEVKERTYLFLVPGTTSTDTEYSYVRAIREGTKNYYVDSEEGTGYEKLDADGIAEVVENSNNLPDGTRSFSQTTITNALITNSVSVQNFEAKKEWADEDNLYGIRPAYITYTLKRKKTLNGVTTEDTSFSSRKTVSEQSDPAWTAKWSQCAAFAADGGAFTYYITEDSAQYYAIAVAANIGSDTMVYTFTNTFVPQMKTISAYKYWDDKSNKYSTRPTDIRYELWCEYDLYEVAKDDNGYIIYEPAPGNSKIKVAKIQQVMENGVQKKYIGKVYDSEAASKSLVYQYMKAKNDALNAQDPSKLTEQNFNAQFTKTLSTSQKVDDDTNTWKVDFAGLPQYINTCTTCNTDTTYNALNPVGKASEVTYYVKEIVNDQTTTLYDCADHADSKTSDQKTLKVYAKPESNTVTCDANGLFTVSKAAFVNGGTMNLLFSDLQTEDIYGNKYTYSVAETNSGGTELSAVPAAQQMKIAESSFHDNTNGTTSFIVSKDLPKVYFKVQRYVSDDNDKEIVIKNASLERISVTISINGVNETFEADSTGVIAIPRVYSDTAQTSKIVDVTITGLPAKDRAGAAYHYSVVECNNVGTALSVADADKMSCTFRASNDNSTLTVTKPLGTEEQNVYFKLSRTVSGNTTDVLKKNIIEKPVAAEVNAEAYKVDNEGIISVPRSNANNGTLTVKVNDLPKSDGSSDYAYTVEEYTKNNDNTYSVASSNTLTYSQEVDSSDNTKVNLTVSKDYPRTYFQLIQTYPDTHTQTVMDGYSLFCKGEEIKPDSNKKVDVSHLLAIYNDSDHTNKLIMEITNLQKSNGNNDYIYSVKVVDKDNLEVSPAPIITVATPYEVIGETVKITLTQEGITLFPDEVYFKVKRNTNEVVKSIVTSDTALTARKLTITEREPDNLTGWLTSSGDRSVSITNKLETRDILVTKNWNDNYYGKQQVNNDTDPTSTLSKNLHYKTALTLASTDLTVGGNNYSETKYLNAVDSDNKIGVVFHDLPIYKSDGTIIKYTVTEAKDSDNDHKCAEGNDISKVGFDSWKNTDQENYYDIEDDADKKTNGSSAYEFEQLTGIDNQSYGYDGTAKKYTKDDDSEPAKAYLVHYDITDELPLTSVKANKHWLDQNNEFSLRPTNIKDMNKADAGDSTESAITSDYLALTLSRQLSTDIDNWSEIAPVTTKLQNDNSVDWFTDWYESGTKETPVSGENNTNEWSYTYKKLLKCNENNTAYYFRIEEDKLNAYEAPQYVVADDYDQSVVNTKQKITVVDTLYDDQDDTTEEKWDGLTRLNETFEITNKLDTRSIKVYKTWDDKDNHYSTRYNIDVTLSNSTLTNNDANKTNNDNISRKDSNGKYSEKKTIDSTVNGLYVEFTNLPKYDKNGSTIIYNVREDANVANDPAAAALTAVDVAQKQGTLITVNGQKFTDGDRHYNYVGSSTYVADADTVEAGTSAEGGLFTIEPEYVSDGQYTLLIKGLDAEHITDVPYTYSVVNASGQPITGATISQSAAYEENSSKKVDLLITKTASGQNPPAFSFKLKREYTVGESTTEEYITTQGLKAESVVGKYVKEYYINNKLPLTAVKVEKTWDDNNNEFDIRPTAADFKDKLTLYRSQAGVTATTSTALEALTWNTLSSTTDYNSTVGVDDNTDNKYTYTYYEILKYDNSNNPYIFKITEDHVKGYDSPNYTTQYLNYVSVAPSDITNDGTRALYTPLAVTNTLITRTIKVYKQWDDNGHTETRYPIDVTLSSTVSNNGVNNTVASGDTPAHTRNDSNSNSYKETFTIQTTGDKYVEFTKLPVFDADGNVIVYNLREEASTAPNPVTSEESGTVSKKTESEYTVSYAPAFVQKNWKYGYTGTAEYIAAATEAGKSDTDGLFCISNVYVYNNKYSIFIKDLDTTGEYKAVDKDGHDISVELTRNGSVVNIIKDETASNPFEFKLMHKVDEGDWTPVTGVMTAYNTGVYYVSEYYIKNTLPVRSFTANKVWDDDNNRDNIRPSSLTFTLKRKILDNDYSTVATGDATPTSWSVTFDKLLTKDENNYDYTYDIVEPDSITTNPHNLTSTYTLVSGSPTTNGTTYTFTNRHPIEQKQLKVKKIWNDGIYKNSVRVDSSKVTVQLWCRFLDSDGTTWIEKQVSEDAATDNKAIKSKIDAKVTELKGNNTLASDYSYLYDPKLNSFTAVDDIPETNTINESEYESTYTFDYLPVYVHLDSTATDNGTSQEWHAVTYYVKEVFENGYEHIYQTEYSKDNTDGSYYSTPYATIQADTGTNLLDNNQYPTDNNMIYVKNTPVTRDILVTKEWNDNYYGTTANDTGKTTELSKNLHYNTAMTLESTDIIYGENNSQHYTSTKVLSKTDSDLGKALVFKDMPIYNSSGDVIRYKVTEAKTTDTGATDEDIGVIGGDGGYSSADYNNSNNHTPANTDSTGEAFVEFVQDTSNRSYGYEGSAEKYQKTENAKTYLTLFHITDELPLTSVKANKHWLDQNNEFSLRPTNIKDMNKANAGDSTESAITDSLDLKLKRNISSESSWSEIAPVTTQLQNDNSADWFTDWYSSEKATSITGSPNDWSYTYKKLLKYDENDSAYNFRIEEDKLNAYEAPQYVVADDYDQSVVNTKQKITVVDTLYDDQDDTTEEKWDGLTRLNETFEITNKLDTRDITVYKHWYDNNSVNLRYGIDVTLSSDAANNGAANTAKVPASGGDAAVPAHTRNTGGTNSTYEEVKTITTTNDGDYVVFEKLPKYDKNGSTIIYNVREDASGETKDGATGESITSAHTGSVATISSNYPQFTPGANHYGYTGSAKYSAATETVGGEAKVYATAYYITNTLPLTRIKVQKEWANSSDYAETLSQYRNRAVTFELQRNSGVDTNNNKVYSYFNDVDDAVDQHSKNVAYNASSMSAQYTDLPVYDYNNTAFTYKVVETPVTGYTTSYSYSYTDSESNTQTGNTNIVPGNGTDTTVTVTNTQITGNAEFVKVDQNHYDEYGAQSGYTDIYVQGATFRLTLNDATNENPVATPVYVKKYGDYYVLDTTSSEQDRNNTVVSGSDGKISFKGLPLNTYKLVETVHPQGYNLRADPVIFTVSQDTTDPETADVTYDSGFIHYGDNRIGNLQHVEEALITLTKLDKSDQSKRLPDATFYLLKLIPYSIGQSYLGLTKPEYIANAVQAIKDAQALAEPYLTEDVLKYWSTNILSETNTILPHIYTTDSNGEIRIEKVHTATYVFLEVKAPEGYELSYKEPFEITATEKVAHIEYMDPRKNASLNVLKENENGDPLNGAEFELYYQPSVDPVKYYSINSSVTPPTPKFSLNPSGVTFPKAASAIQYQYTTSYNTVSVPSPSDSNWILPRTDNDYIFWEDYIDQYNWYWKEGTTVNTDYNNSRMLTKGDLDNESGNKVVAEFKDANGNVIGKYGVWERFVYYGDTNRANQNENHRMNVIWKIQPPDGAKEVRFILGWGADNNSTQWFTFKKGMLYKRQENGKGKNVTESDWMSTNTSWDDLDPSGTSAKSAGQSGIAYKPTANKLVFRRNHHYCWDNIHIMFYDDYDNVIGEQFPGYLMEPYVYAGSNYKINFDNSVEKDGDLCYEITIPEGAKKFRINNGTKTNNFSGTFAGYGTYYTALTTIATDTNKKNNGNYWKFADGQQEEKQNGTLTKWYDSEITKGGDTVADTNGTAFAVDSDVDFIYFKKPSGWKDHIYAYFYAGGDLRADNWQRAVYSIWPGLIPYGSSVASPASPNYNNFSSGIGSMTLVPGSTFKDANGNTLYRFRLPMGDNTNYKNVIFSDGMIGSGDSSADTGLGHGDGGRNESKMISYTAGNAYDKDAYGWQIADSLDATKTYMFRDKQTGSATSNIANAEYIYIRKSPSTNWDDLHIRFYNASGGEILQTGTGYVMPYVKEESGYQYFRVPVPSNAAKFSVNNGVKNSTGTALYPVISHNQLLAAGLTNGAQVYELKANNTLELVSPKETVTVTHVATGGTVTSAGIDYTIRTHEDNNTTVNDCVWIKNTDDWDSTNFKAITFMFYDAGGQQITSSDKEYPAFERLDDTDSKNWICKEIPVNAASFKIKYNGTVSAEYYPIYPQAEEGTTKTFTTGDMIYETTGNGTSPTLSLSWPMDNYYTTEAQPTNAWYSARDYLYLVDTAASTAWYNMRVVFYDEHKGPINDQSSNQNYTKEVSATKLGSLTAAVDGEIAIAGETTTVAEAVGTWYRIEIPESAAYFMLYDTSAESATKQSDEMYPIFPKRDSYSSRKTDYTLGNMQYSIAAPGSGDSPSKYALTRIYPVFTETEEPESPNINELQTNTGSQTADDINKANGAPLTRYTDVEPYASLPVATAPTSTASAPSDTPVLYATTSNNISYAWTETNYYDYLRFVTYDWWDSATDDNTPEAYFVNDSTNSGWLRMFDTGETYGNTNRHIWAVKIPSGNYTKACFRIYQGNSQDNNYTVTKKFADDNSARAYGNGLLYSMINTGSLNNQGYGNQNLYYENDYTDPHTSGIVVPQDNKIRFKNSESWTEPITATFTVSSTPQSPVTMVAESGDIYSCDVPDNATAVEFRDSSSTPKTSDSITLDNSNSHGKNMICQKVQMEDWVTGNYVYFNKPDPKAYVSPYQSQSWGKLKVVFSNDSYNETYNSEDSRITDAGSLRQYGQTNILTTNAWKISFDLTKNWTKVQFYDITRTVDGITNIGGYSQEMTLSNFEGGTGKMNYFYLSNASSGVSNGQNDTSGPLRVIEYSTYYDWGLVAYVPEPNPVQNYSVTYQPEDRNGYINNVTDTTDNTTGSSNTTGNFLTIVDNSSMTDPYIRFYSDSAGNTIIGEGISLENAKLNGTTEVKQPAGNYLIRLPKNALSVSLYDGNTQVGSLIPLENDGGSTLTVTDNGGTKTVTKSQTQRSSAFVSDPEYKTDLDYIYFTDNDSWGSGGTMYAYFYGGADGEYNSWPGVPAAGSYTDNSGKTVYYFRPPTSSGSTPYPFVIFNNGSASDRSITQKIEYDMGKNYTPDSTTTAYGETTGAANACSGTDKYDNVYTREEYTKYSPTERYIYIVNNGTADVTRYPPTGSRFTFDEMHVTFYSDANGAEPVGTGNPGYYADKLEYSSYNGSTVYKISVPKGAKYFRISNGQGKGIGSEQHYRQSVVEQLSVNGLYRFIDASDNPQSVSYYWNYDYTASSNTDLNSHDYKLRLINERVVDEEDDEPVIGGTDPVYLATVETGYDGLIKWITHLKEKTADGKIYNREDASTYKANTVDDEYLDHTVPGDIQNTNVNTVKVKKWGKYFWKETKAPVGYELDKDVLDTFTIGAAEADTRVNVFTATDTRVHGSIRLTKNSEEALGDVPIGSPLAGAEFELYKKTETTGQSDTKLCMLKKTGENSYYVVIEKTDVCSIVTDGGNRYLNVTDEELKEKLKGYELYGDSNNSHFKIYEKAVTGTDTTVQSYNGTEHTTRIAEEGLYTIPVTEKNSDNKYTIIVSGVPKGWTYRLAESSGTEILNTALNNTTYNGNGTSTLRFEVTDSSDDDLSFKLQYSKDNGTNWNDLQTGKLYIENLDWGRYYLKEVTAPDGYSEGDTYKDSNGLNTVEPNKVSFSVGRNNSQETQELICTDEIEPAKLKITKQLDEYIEAWGTPTFIFRIKKLSTTDSPTTYERYVTIQVSNATSKMGETELYDIEPGKYEITELNVSRYSPDNGCSINGVATYVTETTFSNGVAIFTVKAGGEVTVNYQNKLDYYDKSTHTDLKLNDVGKGAKAITVEYESLVPITGESSEIQKSALKGYFIKADGTRERISADDLNTLSITYVSKTVPQGETPKDDPQFAIDFNDNSAGNKIVITNPSRYADSVYTLKAKFTSGKYSGLETTFDITFAGNGKKPKEYEKTIIFHADSSNLSYFKDGGTETSQYIFTYSMVRNDNDDGYEVYSIRHNGVAVADTVVDS